MEGHRAPRCHGILISEDRAEGPDRPATSSDSGTSSVDSRSIPAWVWEIQLRREPLPAGKRMAVAPDRIGVGPEHPAVPGRGMTLPDAQGGQGPALDSFSRPRTPSGHLPFLHSLALEHSRDDGDGVTRRSHQNFPWSHPVSPFDHAHRDPPGRFGSCFRAPRDAGQRSSAP